MVHLNDPFWLILLVLVPPLYWLSSRRRKALKFSRVSMHDNLRSFTWVGALQAASFYSALFGFVVAFAQPSLYLSVEKPSIEARDFVLLIDTSDSMEWGMVDPTISDGLTEDTKPSILTGAQKKNIVKRIQAAEASIQKFLRQREGDRVGFIIFDKQAYYGWPLTDDLNVIRRFVKGLPNYVGSGTEFDGKKGAIPAALTHFKERGQSETKVIVMVTDGEGEIADERIHAMSSILRAQNVKLYVIGIGYKKWEEVPETEDLRNLVKAVDGKIIEVLDVEQMRVAFDEINQLEKSTVIKEASLEETDIAHWFMIFGLISICLFGAFVVLTHDEF